MFLGLRFFRVYEVFLRSFGRGSPVRQAGSLQLSLKYFQ